MHPPNFIGLSRRQLEGPEVFTSDWGRASNELAYMAQRVHHLVGYRIESRCVPCKPSSRPVRRRSSAPVPSMQSARRRRWPASGAAWTNGSGAAAQGACVALEVPARSVELGLFELDPLPQRIASLVSSGSTTAGWYFWILLAGTQCMVGKRFSRTRAWIAYFGSSPPSWLPRGDGLVNRRRELG